MPHYAASIEPEQLLEAEVLWNSNMKYFISKVLASKRLPRY